MSTKGTNKAVNSEKMYDNVMNKFKWGGVNNPDVYLDENTMRMCKSFRMALFSKLAGTLIAEGKNDKALKVLDKAMGSSTGKNGSIGFTVPLSIGEFYFTLNQKRKSRSSL